jgi:MFS family permease
LVQQNALGYAALFGIKDDAHLKGQEYSWLGSIFYFGYLAMEFPSLYLITKVPIGKYIGICVLLWGIALCLMAVCHNFAGLATIRFLLGVFEAVLLPCMLVINSLWYRREEQPLRTAFWYNTFAGVFGGILSYAIGGIDGPLATWKVSNATIYFLASGCAQFIAEPI